MDWRDDALVLGTRRYGEASVILELMTRRHGRHLGLVHGGRSRRRVATLQAGNGVEAAWRARNDDALGTLTVEPTVPRAARLMACGTALRGVALIAHHLRLLPERDPHPALFEAAEVVVEHLDDAPLAAPLVVRFEVALLAELGFGLDLAACAVTGSTQELTYVSPRTGRAVSRPAGEPYRDRLLALPAFLVPTRTAGAPDAEAVAQGFRLTGHFLQRLVLAPRERAMPECRDAFLTACLAHPALAKHPALAEHPALAAHGRPA